MSVRVAAAHTIIEPYTVSFVTIGALVTSVAVFRPRRLYHFAVGAKLVAGEHLQNLSKCHLIFLTLVFKLVSLHIARLRSHSNPPRYKQFDADKKRRDHEIVDIKDWLDDDELSDHNVEEEDHEENRGSIIP